MLNLLREKVITQFDTGDLLVTLKTVNQEHQASVVKTAWAHIESLEVGLGQSLSKHLENFITKKVLIAYESLKFGLR